MQRTIRLQLNTTAEQATILKDTLAGFTTAFNYVCNYGWQHKERNSVSLHKATYYDVRATLPNLPSQLVCAARVKASEALKSVFALVKKYPEKVKAWETKKANPKSLGKVYKGKKPNPPSCPNSPICPIRYDARSYWLKWPQGQVSLTTTCGRVIVDFSVPEYAQKYIGFAVDSADLLYRKGKFWLHVVVTLPEPITSDNGETIGVDLGLNNPAVTSKRKFVGNRYWKEVDRRNFRLKRSLQAKGTKSAKRHLKKLAGRQVRFRRDCDHVLSKRIVQSASSGTTLVIENLTEIRSHTKIKKKTETSRRVHSWTFRQFRSFLEYKAQEAGMRVVAIDPRHTSQTCSKCGFQSRSNRKSQALFLCRNCAYQLNADLNAVYNIRDKHLATLGISLGSGLPSISLSQQVSA